MKKEKKKLSLDDLEIESFETKVAPIVVGGSGSTPSILSCAHSSCSRGGPC
ncbi:MAG TPA: pinensin family lanthipeptide [Thermoanaerobaculia bacterium]|nr:pinensin family lanthipeptide [Thermoanaerobaculia bacterium]